MATDTKKPASQPVAPIAPMLVGLDAAAAALGLSRRTLERERAAGRFPKPDRIVGRRPLWKPATLAAWIDAGGPVAE